ncbi:MAG: DUF2490 domain-containing protein [Brumimicrobium sp.]
MKFFLTISFCVLFFSMSYGQNRFWLSSEVRTDIFTKDLRIQGALHSRFYDHGRYDKIFPEVSLKYKVNSWFKPSFDYRYIFNQSRTNDRRSVGHRINLNLNTDFDYGRWDFKPRIRFQYKFRGFSGDNGYDPDFDNAIRFKPKLKYDIKGSKFDPVIESEWYYNPNLGEAGRQFTKYRFAIGVEINLPKKHELTVKYRYDYEFNIADPFRHHIISLAHTYEYKRKNFRADGL